MKTILIIEDEEGIRKGISEILTFEGYKVLLAANGREGLEQVKNYIPDLILCDLLMPEMNGFEVLEQLSTNPKTALIPFVFISAFGERENLRKGMELGANDFLHKPFTHNELLNAINAHLKRSQKIEQAIDKVKENIVFSFLHEFNTPLNQIIGFSQLIQDSSYSFSMNEIISIGKLIYKSGNQLHSLFKKFIIYINIETNQSDKTDKRNVDIFHLLQELKNEINQKYSRKTDFKIEPTQATVQANEEWLYFALTEIVDNAFKFSEPGQKVILKTKPTKTNLEFIIQDNGRGFPPGTLDKINIFVQFEREHFEQQGVGLGLFLAKKIAEYHNGKLTIENNVKSGSTVTLSIPI